MRYVVGVDGGGTRTTAVVFAEDAGPLASASSGPANHRSVGVESAARNVAAAVSDALCAAELPLEGTSALGLCLAGFDTDLDLPVPQRAVGLLGYTGAVLMENDVVGAWAGATEAGAGVVVIAGTGSTALGMNTRGDLWRTDGWDYILGDSGSGYEIGRSGIRAAMRALDGRIPPTLLARELGAAFDVRDAEGMRRLVDGGNFGKMEIASFAAHVSKAADNGDGRARKILAAAGADLAEQARAIIARLDMARDAFPVAAVGSVFTSVPWVTEPFRRLIKQLAPRAQIRAPLYAPEVGAAILALRRLDDGDLGSWTLNRGGRQITRSLSIAELSSRWDPVRAEGAIAEHQATGRGRSGAQRRGSRGVPSPGSVGSS
jgi:N-acetylglucosamine kinase-like BadF-type ATPase